FGNTTVVRETVKNRFRYDGEQYDAVMGQYYLRARYYNPVIGRFTQEDTYYGDGLNLYAYCANNPVGYEDPSGHQVCPVQKAVYSKYREQGMSKKEAYEAMKKELGIERKSGYKDSGTSPDFGKGKNSKKNGATRAAQYSSGWGNASLQEAINKFAPNAKPVVTSKGKIIYHNPKTGISVVYDKNCNYFRIQDTTRPGSRNYLDLDGNDMNNEVVNGKTRGRSKSDYQKATHFNNTDK
ncbi:MAG: RHS repeat-associated core domain-containing protein, partial [Lachnospiraceae bacterium]|nr:RHS repeat-associated core domain-containing protein [Lachnospiraceae bacterium]